MKLIKTISLIFLSLLVIAPSLHALSFTREQFAAMQPAQFTDALQSALGVPLQQASREQLTAALEKIWAVVLPDEEGVLVEKIAMLAADQMIRIGVTPSASGDIILDSLLGVYESLGRTLEPEILTALISGATDGVMAAGRGLGLPATEIDRMVGSISSSFGVKLIASGSGPEVISVPDTTSYDG